MFDNDKLHEAKAEREPAEMRMEGNADVQVPANPGRRRFLSAIGVAGAAVAASGLYPNIVSAKKASESGWFGTSGSGWFNVKDFGASGDGVTDDTAAIQAAIDAAAVFVESIVAAKSDVVTAAVLVPSGIYAISDTILVKEGVSLVGVSASSCVIKPTHTGVAVQMGGSDREYSHVLVKGLTIYGNSTGTMSYGLWTTTTTIGIKVLRCLRECAIEDCTVTRCQTSIDVENTFGFEISDNLLMYATDYHIKSDNLTNSTIRGNRIDWAEKTGIYLDCAGANSTIGLLIDSNAIQICWQNGVYVHDADQVTFLNNFFESNYREAATGVYTYADIQIESGPNNRGLSFTVIGGFHTHGSSPSVDAYTAIRCNKAETLNVFGVTCRDNAYRYFIDANNAAVKSIVAIGNATTTDAQEIAYTSASTTGILGNVPQDGQYRIPKLATGSYTGGTTITSSNASTDSMRNVYLIDTSAGNRSLTLKDADCTPGRTYVVKKTSVSNDLTIAPEAGSSKLVEGAASYTLAAGSYGSAVVVAGGTGWWIVSA